MNHLIVVQHIGKYLNNQDSRDRKKTLALKSLTFLEKVPFAAVARCSRLCSVRHSGPLFFPYPS